MGGLFDAGTVSWAYGIWVVGRQASLGIYSFCFLFFFAWRGRSFCHIHVETGRKLLLIDSRKETGWITECTASV
jgi:hypothetical protein